MGGGMVCKRDSHFRLLFVGVTNTMPIRKLGRKGFIPSYRLKSIIKSNQGRSFSQNPEAGTEAETASASCFLPCLVLQAVCLRNWSVPWWLYQMEQSDSSAQEISPQPRYLSRLKVELQTWKAPEERLCLSQ